MMTLDLKLWDHQSDDSFMAIFQIVFEIFLSEPNIAKNVKMFTVWVSMNWDPGI